MPFYRTGNVNQDFNDWDSDQNNAEGCPICCVCGEPIMDDQYIEYEGDYYHLEDCSDEFLDRVKAEYTVTKQYYL